MLTKSEYTTTTTKPVKRKFNHGGRSKVIVESDEEMLFTFLKRKDSLNKIKKLLSSIDTV